MLITGVCSHHVKRQHQRVIPYWSPKKTLLIPIRPGVPSLWDLMHDDLRWS